MVVDVESTSTDPMAAELVGIALTAQEGKGYYVPVGHRDAANLALPRRSAEALAPLLAGSGHPQVCSQRQL